MTEPGQIGRVRFVWTAGDDIGSNVHSPRAGQSAGYGGIIHHVKAPLPPNWSLKIDHEVNVSLNLTMVDEMDAGHFNVRFAIAAVLLLGLALTAFVLSAFQRQVNGQEELIVQLAELNDSGVAGDATLTDNGDGTISVDVLLTGATGAHPMHIHKGSCESPGEIVIPLAETGDNGGSVTAIAVSFSDLSAMGPLAIVVHRSASEMENSIACGSVGDELHASETNATEVAHSEEELLYSATSGEDFVAWQADFWIHADGMLSTESNTQTYILAPFELGQQDSYVLEAEIRLGGSFSEFEPPCHSYFGFMFGLLDPSQGIVAGLSDIGDPSLNCSGVFATWTPWIERDQPVTRIDVADSGLVIETLMDDEWHDYRLEIEGQTLTLSIDNVTVFSSASERYSVVGEVGIVSGNLALELRSFRILEGPSWEQANPSVEPDEPAAAVTTTPGTQTIDPPTGEAEWTSYTNDTIGITLSYPASWTVVESPDHLLVVFLPPEADPESLSANIAVSFVPDLPYRSDDEVFGSTAPSPIVVSGVSGRTYDDDVSVIPFQSTTIEIPYRSGTLFLSATIGPSVDLRLVFAMLLDSVQLEDE